MTLSASVSIDVQEVTAPAQRRDWAFTAAAIAALFAHAAALAAEPAALPARAARHIEQISGSDQDLRKTLTHIAQTMLAMMKNKNSARALAPLFTQIHVDRQCLADHLGDAFAAEEETRLEGFVLETDQMKDDWRAALANMPVPGNSTYPCDR